MSENLALIEEKIYIIRGQRVMLDADLAEVYQVETKNLNRAVKRNIERFPEDFMFQLTEEEFENLRCQFVTSSSNYGGRRYLPYVFTEHGAVMLASVLKSKTAIEASLQVVRAFVRLRTILAEHKELAAQIEKLERKMGVKFDEHDEQIKILFAAINRLIQPPKVKSKSIGFIADKKKK
jgi:phage regulator Rha-like protein